MNGRYMMLLKKTLATGRHRPKRTDAAGKSHESEVTLAAGAGQNNVARHLANALDEKQTLKRVLTQS